jgi:Domain of unknown function (DUF1707)/Domain of unknown function (DUF4190)
VTENQSQWPAHYPRYGPAGSAAGGGAVGSPAGGGWVGSAAGGGGPAGHQVSPGGDQIRMTSSMRAATADRERAVDVLKAGFAEGRLTQEEYNDRMGRAYAARTYGELAALTADLPHGAMPTWQPPVYQPPPGTNSMAIASMVLGVAEFFTAGLTAIPAVICGHIARRQMRQTAERGDGLATSGLVLGYMGIIFWTAIIAAAMVGFAISISHTGSTINVGPGGPAGP